MQKNVSSVLALERAVWGHMAAIKLPPTERQALVYFVTTFIPSLAEWLHSSPGRRRHETTQNKSDKYGYDGGIYRRPDLAFTNHESKCGLVTVVPTLFNSRAFCHRPFHSSDRSFGSTLWLVA
ncbi:hypothetical protein D918_09382 [Trichuris suis]|nr:hypothetical protein D918_09382 [Trichuris suis]